MDDMQAAVAAAESWLSGVDQCTVFCTKHSLHGLGHWISCQQDAIAQLSEGVDRSWHTRLRTSSGDDGFAKRRQRGVDYSVSLRRASQLSFQGLPRTIAQQIAHYLPFSDRLALSLTCRRMLDICRGKRLWDASLPFPLTRKSVRLLYGARYLTAATSLEITSAENDVARDGRRPQRRTGGKGKRTESLGLVAAPQTDDQLLSLASKLFPDVESLQFYSTESDGSSLSSLLRMKKLRVLELGITNLDDAHFKRLVTAQETFQFNEAERVLENSWFGIEKREYHRVLGITSEAERRRRSHRKKKKKKKKQETRSTPSTSTRSAEERDVQVAQHCSGDCTESVAFTSADDADDDSRQTVFPLVMSPRIPQRCCCFEGLQKLSLYCCDSLSGASFAAVLSRLRNLQSFCVVSPDTALDLSGLSHLSAACEELYIDTKSHVPKQTLAAVLQRCENLKALALCPFPPSYFDVVSEYGAACISVLCLQHRNSTAQIIGDEREQYAISSADLRHFETAAFLPHLEELQLGNLSATRGLASLCRVVSKAPLLRSISLGYAHISTPLLFKTMQRCNTKLVSLTLRRCTLPLILTDELVEYFDDDAAEQRRLWNSPQQRNPTVPLPAAHPTDVLAAFAAAVPSTVKDLGLLDYNDEMSGSDLLRFAVLSHASSFDFSRSTTLSRFNQREKVLFEQLLQKATTRAVSLRGCSLPPFSQTVADFCVASHGLLERLMRLYQ